MLQVTRRIQIPDTELQFSFARSSGPGGQNVNKVNSKAILRWHATASPALPADVRERFLTKYASRLTTDGELVISSDRHRDQPRNMQDCLDRLKAMILAVATPPKRRRATKPTKASVERRIKTKQKRSGTKQMRRGVRDAD